MRNMGGGEEWGMGMRKEHGDEGRGNGNEGGTWGGGMQEGGMGIREE